METLQCEICLKHYKHLGSHIWHGHKMKAKEYKMEYGLSINHALITNEIKKKKQEKYAENRNYYLTQGLKNIKKYQFKKGQVYRDYFSSESLDKAVKNLDTINSKEAKNCPFCNLLTKHLESHIYNAHGYLKVKRGGD